ncbi:hypothetical protein [Bacillus mycoides]|uniref:hypothetical protein n=1 Tax=Bacillus mycoides TaxID=1405 RepID=UPI002E23560B|nr:hypothetical protein [Bacillus mycoides]MED1024338.1 hypothetical protein [Bacillus mycoides]MED1054641.1 hypothetical protein [Bacillus mycoides]
MSLDLHNTVPINEKLILENLVKSDVLYVYVAGSLMEGFGNKTSDVDVYVIIDGDLPSIEDTKNQGRSLREDTHFINNFIDNGVRYDYEYWTLKDWDNLLFKLNNLNPADPNLVKTFSLNEYDLLHRLKYAKPIYNQQSFNELFSNINFENLAFYYASIKSEAYGNILEDIEGALFSQEEETAFIMSRLLLNEAVNGFLSMHGETNPSNKWIYKKLQRFSANYSDQNLIDDYMNLLIEPKNTNDVLDLRKYVIKVIRCCQDLNIKTQNMLLRKDKI